MEVVYYRHRHLMSSCLNGPTPRFHCLPPPPETTPLGLRVPGPASGGMNRIVIRIRMPYMDPHLPSIYPSHVSIYIYIIHGSVMGYNKNLDVWERLGSPDAYVLFQDFVWRFGELPADLWPLRREKWLSQQGTTWVEGQNQRLKPICWGLQVWTKSSSHSPNRLTRVHHDSG